MAFNFREVKKSAHKSNTTNIVESPIKTLKIFIIVICFFDIGKNINAIKKPIKTPTVEISNRNT
ncbi:hypothetical protein AGMMS49921_08020 [Endomicrobiia bacterium]|nr:hypothetical protein AGMMS49921_08020 [Endomicrobiia bacterium]